MLMLINVWVEVGQEEGWGGGEGGGRGGAIGQWHSKILMKSVNIWTLRLIFFFHFWIRTRNVTKYLTTWIFCLLETYAAENAWQKIKRCDVLRQSIKYCFIVYIPFNIFTRTLKDSFIFHHYKYYSDEQIIKKTPKIQFWKKTKKKDWLIDVTIAEKSAEYTVQKYSS